MFYGKDSIENQFDPLLKKLGEQELFLFEPMPSYKLNVTIFQLIVINLKKHLNLNLQTQ